MGYDYVGSAGGSPGGCGKACCSCLGDGTGGNGDLGGGGGGGAGGSGDGGGGGGGFGGGDGGGGGGSAGWGAGFGGSGGGAAGGGGGFGGGGSPPTGAWGGGTSSTQASPLLVAGGSLGPEPGNTAGRAGSTTLGINGDPDSTSNVITRTDCLKVPLRTGGMLPLRYVFNYSATTLQFQNGFCPAGGLNAMWSFYPVLNPMVSSVTGETTEDGQVEYLTPAAGGWSACSTPVPRIVTAAAGSTYYTTYDERKGTYYEYWGNGPAPNGYIVGRMNRFYDSHGNELDYQTKFVQPYNNQMIPTGIVGNAIGRAVPYFEFTVKTGHSDPFAYLTKMYLSDLDSPASSRTVYFDYALTTYTPVIQALIYPNGCTTQFNFNVPSGSSKLQLLSEVDAEGYVTYFEYYPSLITPTPQVTKTVEPEGRITYYNYTNVYLGDTTSMAYLGRPATYFTYMQSPSVLSPLATLQADSLGNTTRWGYDATLDRVIQRTDPIGATTYFGYISGSAANQYAVAWQMRLPDGALTYFGYGITYDLMRIVGPRNAPGYPVVTYFEYNPTRERTAMVDAAGARTSYLIDSIGRRVATQDARGNTTYFNYGNATGHVDAVSFAEGSTVYFGYNSFRDRLREISPRWPEQGYAAFTSYYQYDQLSRMIRSIDPLGNVTYFDWTPRSDLLDTVDALGVDTSYTYNGLRLMTRRTVTDQAGKYFAQTLNGYDIYKNKVQTQDARGFVTYYFYDILDRLTAVQDPLANLSYFSYDGVGNGLTYTDALNHTTYYFYDQFSRMSSGRNALGNAAYFFYDLGDNRTASIDPLGNPGYFFYDQLNRIQATRDALGYPTYFYYDATSNQTARMDARFNSTTFAFDSRNRMTALRDALGNVTYFNYDRASNLGSRIDARKNTTYFFYDTLDRMMSARDAVGNSTYFFYDAVGNRTKTVDARGNAVYFAYDALRRVAAITDAVGGYAYFTYDLESNLTDTMSVVSPIVPGYGSQPYGVSPYGGNQVANRITLYDGLSRPITLVDTLGDAIYFAYDAVGNLSAVTDPDNHATLVQYDALNRPSAIRMPDMGSAYFFYDAGSNRTKEVDALGNTTYYTYDALNRPAQIRDALGRSLYFGYDQVGNLAKYVDAELGTSYFTYDAINRRTNVTYQIAGADLATSLRSSAYFVYDPIGNVTAVGDLSGLQVLGYDALNRLCQRKNGQGSTVYYFYDAVSNVIARRYPGASGVAYYAYDAANRQTAVQAPSGATAYFKFDLSRNPTGKVLGNNVQQAIVYDADDRIQNWRYAGSAGAPLTYFDYTRDAKGLIIQAVREANYTVYYTYDPDDRLLSELWAKTGSTPSEVYGYRYAYDLSGNRTKALINGSASYYYYDQANQLKVTGTTSAWATPSYYIYDKNGSLTNLVEPAGATYFGYNTAGFISRIRWKDASATYFYYDGNLQRYGMTALGTTTYFVWDGPNLLQELNSNGTVKEEYNNARAPIPGIGQLVEINRPGQTPQKIYPVMDPRGTVTKQLQSDGLTVQAAKEYDSFGNIIPNSSSGTWIGRFSYQGQSWMEITSSDSSKRLLLSPTRIYDPVTGRFLQRDPYRSGIPLLDGLNLYTYVAAAPFALVDPSGLKWAMCGSTPYDDEEQCCVDSGTHPCGLGGSTATLVQKKTIAVINRSGGNRTGASPTNGGHIDMWIPGTGLFGFYGTSSHSTSGIPAGPLGVPGMGLTGYVLNTPQEWMDPINGRQQYVIGPEGLLSTICEVKVCPDQVGKMNSAASALKASPGTFNIVGSNCANKACGILGAGGIDVGGPIVQTPQGVIDDLSSKYGAKCYNGWTQLFTNGSDIRLWYKGPPPEGTPGPNPGNGSSNK